MCLLLLVARPKMMTALSGNALMLDCSQKPVAPVNWTYMHSPDSEVQHIITDGSVVSDYTDRFDIHGSSLVIREVQLSDGGSYTCSDVKKDVFMYNVTVVGEKLQLFLDM